MEDKFKQLVTLYRKLSADVENGLISISEFIRQIDAAAIQDESDPGNWWNISHETGEWLCYSESTGWIAKAPQGFPLIAAAPPKRKSPPSTAYSTPPQAGAGRKRGLPVWAIVTIALSSFFVVMAAVIFLVYPSMRKAMDRSNQATSVYNVVMMGQCVDRYIQDNPKIGCPRVKSITSLQAILNESGIDCDEKLIRDGWGNLLEYEVGESYKNRVFSITSLGSDGFPGPPVYPNWEGELIVNIFDEDIIYSSGRLTQHPQGAQTTR